MKPQKLRILFLVLEMDFGGLQRVVNLLIRMIDPDVFEPYLVCLDHGGVFYEQAASVCADSFIVGRRPGAFDKDLFLRLLAILKNNKIDIIHSHNGCSSYAALAGRLVGVKGIIHTDHGRLVPDKKTAILEDRLSSYLMNRVIGVSTELTEYLRSTVHISNKKLRTIINGVDDQAFRPRSSAERDALRSQFGYNENDKVIGTVCRLDPIKNLAFMISCMPAILRKVPAAKLVIIGDGPVRTSLIKQVDALGISSTIQLPGLRRDIGNLMPLFDVYACTSLSEGTSMTILEAMSCSLPIVASAVGGNVRLVDDTNGFLFPQGDAERFVDAIVKLFGEETGRSMMGKRSRERIQRDFCLERMVHEYERLYVSLV